jgi:Ca2+-binding RTX toxin-like protein
VGRQGPQQARRRQGQRPHLRRPDRDYIVGGNGRDIIKAGKGNDDINVATAGARAKVDCGPGIDTVRVNNNELRSTKHCENILVTTRLGRLKSYNESYRKHKKK